MARAALLGAAIALLPAPALAQAYQCTVPQGAVAVPAAPRTGETRRLPITGYTLALSWSPEHCRGRERSPADQRQCSGHAGRFGLIVHGLWPEGQGQWPQYCPTSRTVSPAEARQNLCMTPSPALLANEWAKHGACMVRDPESYFKVTRILWRSLHLPDLDALSHQPGLTVGGIRTAFATANPGFRRDAVGIFTNDHGWLTEMRLCYGKDFRPAPCGVRRSGQPDSRSVKIWRGL
ncbi:MAG: hypothetical protein RLZZ08_487 [Pseudomonadota bacterium]|jgi:ribonuclease T2